MLKRALIGNVDTPTPRMSDSLTDSKDLKVGGMAKQQKKAANEKRNENKNSMTAQHELFSNANQVRRKNSNLRR